MIAADPEDGRLRTARALSKAGALKLSSDSDAECIFSGSKFFARAY